MDKLTGIFGQAAQQAQQDSQEANDKFPWYFRFLARLAGTLGGLITMFCAVWNLLSIIYVTCILVGVVQIVLGFFVVVFEAPFLCVFIESVNRFAAFSESRPYWQKAILYIAFGVGPLIFCFGFASFVGAIGLVASGVLYGTMAIGKKADRASMMASAEVGAAGAGGASGGTGAGPYTAPQAFGNPWDSSVPPQGQY